MSHFLTKNGVFFKISILTENFDFWLKISIFHQKFQFLTKITIFDQDFYFWPKFRFLTKISLFDQDLDFRPRFGFSTKISIEFEMANLGQNFDFWEKFKFFTNVFDKYCNFLPKIKFQTTFWFLLTKMKSSNFWHNFIFVCQIFEIWQILQFSVKIYDLTVKLFYPPKFIKNILWKTELPHV